MQNIMQLDITPLPNPIQQILRRAVMGEPITIVQSGQVLGNLSNLDKTEHKNSQLQEDKHAYNYDVQAIQQSIESGKIAVPDFNNEQDFLDWINS